MEVFYMTIDEAIAHAREVADTCEYEASKYDLSDSYESHVAYQEGKCAEEHEQFAEWLEELKAYREIGTVEGYKSAIECYTEEYTRRKSNEQYNKAIDDFVHKVKEHQYVLSDVINSKDYGMFTVGIEQIAEQLKAGIDRL